jgi:hypothetical protein
MNSIPDEKMIQATEQLLKDLDKMTDEELLEALEACGDNSLGYAMFPGLYEKENDNG